MVLIFVCTLIVCALILTGYIWIVAVLLVLLLIFDLVLYGIAHVFVFPRTYFCKWIKWHGPYTPTGNCTWCGKVGMIDSHGGFF